MLEGAIAALLALTEVHVWVIASSPVLAIYAICAASYHARGNNSRDTGIPLSIFAASAIFVGLAALLAPDVPSALGVAVFLCGLVYLAVFDFCIMAVPVRPILILMSLGLLAALLASKQALFDRTLAAALGAILFRVLDLLHLKLRGRTGLGAGDALIAALIGAWLAPEGLAWSIALGGSAALAWALLRRWGSERPLPLAPALAAGAASVVFMRLIYPLVVPGAGMFSL